MIIILVLYVILLYLYMFVVVYFVRCSHCITNNTDTGLHVVFEFFTGRVFTVTSTCTFIRVRKTPRVGTRTHTVELLCTQVLYINQRRHLVQHLCFNLLML